eukprot:2473586-Pleurochrysis_carterae.AAC.1
MPECHAPPPSSLASLSLARLAGRVNGLARPAPLACQMLCNDLPRPWSSTVDARRSTSEFQSRSTKLGKSTLGRLAARP